MSLSLTVESAKKYTNNHYFLETGTYKGGGVKVALLAGYENIISIEIDSNLYNITLSQYKNNGKVHLYLGDSEVLFPEIISKINEPITFWLDSHIVPENFSTPNALGIRQLPLLQELDFIKNHPIKTHTILIDDRRMMGITQLQYHQQHGLWITPEWESVTEDIVMKRLFDINPEYKIEYEDTGNAPKDIIVARI